MAPTCSCFPSTKKAGLATASSNVTRRSERMSNWLLEVTDLKQYTCCPRIIFYRYCLPKIRPITYLMEEGIRHHEVEEEREERRSLRHYGVTTGERVFHLALQSSQLSLSGRV